MRRGKRRISCSHTFFLLLCAALWATSCGGSAAFFGSGARGYGHDSALHKLGQVTDSLHGFVYAVYSGGRQHGKHVRRMGCIQEGARTCNRGWASKLFFGSGMAMLERPSLADGLRGETTLVSHMQHKIRLNTIHLITMTRAAS